MSYINSQKCSKKLAKFTSMKFSSMKLAKLAMKWTKLENYSKEMFTKPKNGVYKAKKWYFQIEIIKPNI